MVSIFYSFPCKKTGLNFVLFSITGSVRAPCIASWQHFHSDSVTIGHKVINRPKRTHVLIYGKKKWLTTTVALSATYCAGVMAADLTIAPSNTQVFDGSASFPGGVDVNGGTLVIGGNGGGAGVTLGGNVNATANSTVSGFGAINGNLNVSGNSRVAPGYPVGTPPASPTATSSSMATCR
ncbi:hypothetical protein WJ968_03380 [Achromobacter xylosoxidans]